MADAPSKDLVQRLKELLVTVQKQADEKAQAAAEAQARQNAVARQESLQDQMPALVFLTWDLDSAGNAVARAERTDDPDKVADVSQRIDSAQNAAKTWIISRNGRIVQAGGDEGMGQISSELIPELDQLRKDVRETSGFTVTIGVGPKISNAINARMLGKLLGKNRVQVWDESTDRELEARLLAQGDEESKKIAEAIAEPVKKSEPLEKKDAGDGYLYRLVPNNSHDDGVHQARRSGLASSRHTDHDDVANNIVFHPKPEHVPDGHTLARVKRDGIEQKVDRGTSGKKFGVKLEGNKLRSDITTHEWGGKLHNSRTNYFDIRPEHVEFLHQPSGDWVSGEEHWKRHMPEGITPEHVKSVEGWVEWNEGRDEMPKLEGKLRSNALEELRGATQTRSNPGTGEREYLLHRGVGPREHAAVHHPEHAMFEHRASWTPKLDIADAFAEDHSHDTEDTPGAPQRVSAWIPESKIHHVPHVLSAHSHLIDGRSDEHEVIVDPGTYAKHDVVKKSYSEELAVDQEAADHPEKSQAINLPANLVGEVVEQRDDAVEKLKLPKWSPPQK